LSNDDINGLGYFKNQLDSIGNSVTGFETVVAIVKIAVASFETAVVWSCYL
jgi:hypothetical protein